MSAIITVKYETCDPIFTDNNLDQRNRYKCPECSYLLEDAVQTSCGHWYCHGCANDIFRKSSSPVCPRADCGEYLEIEDGKEFFPDKFVQKQIHRYQVRCRYHYNKCLWTGAFIDLLKHLENCSYKQEECPHCNEMFVASEMTKAECDKHLEEEVANHLRFAVTSLPTTKRGNCDSVCVDEDRKNVDKKKNCTDKFVLKSTHIDIRDHPNPWTGTPIEKLKHLETCVYETKECPHCNEMFSDSEFTDHEKLNFGEEDEKCDCWFFHTISGQSSEPPLADEIEHHQPNELSIAHARHFDHLSESKLDWGKDLAVVLSKGTENEDRDFRLSLMENSNYDGTMVWKIPQFSQRMEDARTGKYTSIFSPPFYSGRYGYKMCLRLYILGDGIGKGSHMSLFFVLMKGEFDNILQWPFTHKVTFRLINQCGGRDVVDIFQPDPLSSSFQKPKTDMNIASGCPRFVSLNELMQNGFIVEDTVFIKVEVDTTMINRHVYN